MLRVSINLLGVLHFSDVHWVWHWWVVGRETFPLCYHPSGLVVLVTMIARVIVVTNFFQMSIFVMAMFIGELGGASWNGPAAFLMGSIALSGFFTYEVCRKLDPTYPKVQTNHWACVLSMKFFLFLLDQRYVPGGLWQMANVLLHCCYRINWCG